MKTLTITVYLDDGRTFAYDVQDASKAREHASAIVRGGYMHSADDGCVFEHYGPHRITKVKVTGGAVPTNYPDRTGGV